MATNKTSNYSVGKDPIELCRPENSEELQKISMVRNQRCSDTKHPSQSSNSISKNLLCSYKHNIVCKRPICSWQIEANERSDWSLSKHYTINSFSTKILKIQNNPLCSGLRLKTKLRKKKKVSSPGSYIAPWALQLTWNATGKQVGTSVPSPSDQLVLPPLLEARTDRTARQLGALSPAMCAAGKQARCTSCLPLRGAVNYNPICSTNCCSPECRIPLRLKNATERAAEQALTARHEGCAWQTDLQTDRCNTILLVMTWALGWNGSYRIHCPCWGKNWPGSSRPPERAGPTPSTLH